MSYFINLFHLNWSKEFTRKLIISYNFVSWFKVFSISSYFMFNYFWFSADEISLDNDLNLPVFTENSVDVLLAQQSAVQAGRFEFTHYSSDREYEQALVNAIWWCRWKTWFSHRSSIQHRALVIALHKQRLLKFQGLLRRQPFGVLIHGGPGTGKSKAAYEIAKRLKEYEGDPLTADQLIVLNESDQFQSEYRSCHKVVVFDDVSSTNLSYEDGDPYRKVIDFINNVPRCALNPHLELKGNVLIKPEIVVMTLNSLHSMYNTQVERGACMRRFPLVISMPRRNVYNLYRMETTETSEMSPDSLGSDNGFHYVVDKRNLSLDELMSLTKSRYLDHILSQESYMKSCALPNPSVEVRSSTSRIKDCIFRSLYSWAGSNERLESIISSLEYKVSSSKVVAQSAFCPQGGNHLIATSCSLVDDLESLSIAATNTGDSSDDESSASIVIERRNEADAVFIHELLNSFIKRSRLEIKWSDVRLAAVESFARYFFLQGDWCLCDGILTLGTHSIGKGNVHCHDILGSRKYVNELYVESVMWDVREQLKISLLPRHDSREEALTSAIVGRIYEKCPSFRLAAREYRCGDRAGDLLYYDFLTKHFVVIEIKYDKSNGVKDQAILMSKCVNDALISSGHSNPHLTGIGCHGVGVDSLRILKAFGCDSSHKKFKQMFLA